MNTKDNKTRFTNKGYMIVGIRYESKGVNYIEPLEVGELRNGEHFSYTVYPERSESYAAPTLYEYESQAKRVCDELNNELEEVRKARRNGLSGYLTDYDRLEVRSVRRTYTILD